MAVTEEAIDAVMREMLPQMEAAALTLNLVMDTLADKFGVDVKELKAQWKPIIKSKVLELMVLCPDYEEQPAENAEDEEEEEEEEEELPKPRRANAASKKRRNAISDESDAQDDGESEAEQSGDDGEAESEDEDEAPKKRRRISKTKERKSPKASNKKKTPPVKKTKATPKQTDPPGLTALKELGRAAGVLNPKVYKALKAAQSINEAEEVVRDRLQEAGVRFSGQYPSAREISAAKKKRARDKELEDIDTSLIIDSGRPRRSAAQNVSYAPAPIPDADGVFVGGGAAANEEEEVEFEEDEADDDDDDDADEDASGSGSNESEAEF